jgi:hypothetical protein
LLQFSAGFQFTLFFSSSLLPISESDVSESSDELLSEGEFSEPLRFSLGHTAFFLSLTTEVDDDEFHTLPPLTSVVKKGNSTPHPSGLKN